MPASKPAKDANYKDCISRIQSFEPSLLDPSARVNPERAETVELWMMHLFTVDLMRGDYALAHHWVRASHLARKFHFDRSVGRLNGFPEVPIGEKRNTFFDSVVASESLHIPIWHSLISQEPLKGEERASALLGIQFAKNRFAARIEAARKRRREYPSGSSMIGVAGELYEAGCDLFFPSQLLNDERTLAQAEQWRRESDELLMSECGTKKWKKFADEHRVKPAGHRLIEVVSSENPQRYAAEFGAEWRSQVQGSFFPHWIHPKAELIAFHLWVERQFKAKIALPEPAGLRNFDSSLYWAQANSPRG
jgi:hypothetical protein